MIDEVMYFEPQIPGYESFGKEPSLYDLVLKYYKENFSIERSDELTNLYFEALSNADNA